MADQGEGGDVGQRGVAGERGPKGDHGQHGETGQKGQRGAIGPQGLTEPVNSWFGWSKWTWATMAFVFIVGVGAFSNWRVERAADIADGKTKQAVIDGDYKTCISGNGLRLQVRTLVTLATDPSSATDLTMVPGFTDLDAATQKYFVSLRDVGRQNRQNEQSTSFRQKALNDLKDRDCEKEYPDRSSPAPQIVKVP